MQILALTAETFLFRLLKKARHLQRSKLMINEAELLLPECIFVRVNWKKNVAIR